MSSVPGKGAAAMKADDRDACIIPGGHLTAFDMESANRFNAPCIAVIGNNSAMDQIRYGQRAKYGEERDNVGNLLSDIPYGKFGEMLGGHGAEARDPAMIAGALERAREVLAKTRRCAVVNIRVGPKVYTPGAMAQTMSN